MEKKKRSTGRENELRAFLLVLLKKMKRSFHFDQKISLSFFAHLFFPQKMPPPPPPPSASANENNNEHALSGAAFLRRAASAGLVSVVKSSNAPLSIPLPPLLLPRAPSASAVLPSSSSLAAAPAVSAFLPLEGLPAPAGLLRALSAQSLPPQVELR